MTTTHTPTPAASNFPLTLRQARQIPSPEYVIESSAPGSTATVASCTDPDWALFLVHAANHHEALLAQAEKALKWAEGSLYSLPVDAPAVERQALETWRDGLRAAVADARRILSESAA